VGAERAEMREVATNEVMSGPGPGCGPDEEAAAAGAELSITTVRSAADLDAAQGLLCHRDRAEAGWPTSGAARPGEASRLLLARRGDEPVGVARLCWGVARRAGEVRRGHLTHLYVRPDARSTGVGDALVRRAGVVAWWSGCEDVRVRAAGWPEAAVAVLRRAGFTPVGEDEPAGELVLVATPQDIGRERRTA
jgi:GNAT superfamily N-acetyltransferase